MDESHQLDLRATDFARNPSPILAWLRERQPVYRLADGTFILSRYDDVRMALKHHELFASGWSDAAIAHPQWLEAHRRRGLFLTETDPPRHTLYRSIVNKSFAAGAIRALEPILRNTASSLVRNIRKGQEFDFLTDFAYPFAGTALSALTGLDVIRQPERARRWVDVAETFTDQCPGPARKAVLEAVVADQNDYFDALVRERRRCPRSDLASILSNASPDGRALSDEELRTALALFTTAGFQAPAQFLAAGIACLAHRPALVTMLRKEPRHIGQFIEEFLRLSNTAQGVFRMTTQTLSLHGMPLPAGSSVLLLIAAANLDPTRFPNPEDLILGRDNIRMHLGFGHGIHVCLGAALARMEMQIALQALIEAFDGIDCPPEPELEWYSTIVGRLLYSLPVRAY